jgi:hypothetical protein
LSYKLDQTWRLSATVGRYFKIPPYTILGFRNNSGVLVNQNSKYTLNHAVIGLEKALGSGAHQKGFIKRMKIIPFLLMMVFQLIKVLDLKFLAMNRSYNW